MTWTPERKQMVKEMLRKGLSANQIAAQFGGVTRNAVIGIVTRDKRLREIGFDRTRGEHDGVRRVRARRIVRKPAFVAPPVVAEPGAILPFGPPQTAGIPMWDDKRGAMLSSHRCKWPINNPEPRTNSHLFCGETTNGGSYCAFHATAAAAAGTESERSASRVLARAA